MGDKTRVVGYGVAAGVVVALCGGALTGCIEDDTAAIPGHDGGPGSGSGGDATVGGEGGGGGGDAEAGAADGGGSGGGDGEAGSSGGPNAIIYLVNAAVSPLAPPMRFCIGLDTTSGGTGGSFVVTPPPTGVVPYPDTRVGAQFPVAGLYPGFGGSTAGLTSLDPSSLTLALFAVDATKIANDTADAGPDGGAELPCSGVIGTDGKGAGGILTPGKDFWYVGTIPQGTLAHGTTWIAALTGCPPGESGASAAGCPQPYDTTKGNLQIIAYNVDNKTAVTGGIGAQLAHASPAWDAVMTQAGATATTAGFYVPPAADAGTGDAEAGAALPSLQPITQSAKFGATLYPAALATVAGVTFDGNSGFFAQAVSGSGAVTVPAGCTPGSATTPCVSPTLLPLPTIDQLTYGAAAPAGGSFANGKGYAFVLVGDPTVPPYLNPLDGGAAGPSDGVFNGKFVHFVAFPTSNP